jgi:hypothetical protein
MDRIRKYLLQFVLLPFVCSLPVQRSSGQVKATATVNKAVVLQDELLRLQFSIENAGEVQQFVPPSFKGCKVIEGPLHSSGTSVVNGAVHSHVSFVYIIQPEAPGDYSLSGGSAKIDNRRFVFNTIRFKVKEAKHNNLYSFQHSNDVREQDQYSDYIIRKGEDIRHKIRQNLFIKVDVNKDHCYEGEPVVATYKLYTRLRSESKVCRNPSFNGFSVYDIADPSSAHSTIEALNGKNFNVYLIRKAQLFPLQSGVLELDPAEVENSISFLSAEKAMKDGGAHLPELLRSFESDDAANDGIITENVHIKSNPVAITVKELPLHDRPESFDGAVGDFSIEATIDKSEVALNDMALLRIIVKGEGNFGVINAPPVQWPEEVEAYEPEIRENVLKTIAPMRGYKTFAYTVMPKRTGTINIPAVEFSYFDPKDNRYKTTLTNAVSIHAVPAVQQDISGVVTEYGAAERGISRIWIAAFAVVLLGLLAFFLTRYIRFPVNNNAPVLKDTGKVVEETASVNQREPQHHFFSNPLYQARLMLIQRNVPGFYAELGRALRNYIIEKLHPGSTWHDKKYIEQQMKEKGLDDTIIAQFQLIIQQCEEALYTPVAHESEIQSVYDLAEDLIDHISKRV